jgi:hypothetical protein
LTDHAAELVRAFVLRNRRDRYLKLLDTTRGRDKFRSALAHFRDLDPRYATRVSGGDMAFAIGARLRAKGAGSTCYVLSESAELDDREVPLTQALDEVYARGLGTFLSCVPGRLAYFEGEEASERYILERTSPAV